MDNTSPPIPPLPAVPQKFLRGDHVRKTKGAQFSGYICGTYSTTLNPEGYAIESEFHPGTVQIFPATMLERVTSPPA